MDKIGEYRGTSTQGYGTSLVRFYSDGESCQLVLVCNGKVLGRLLFHEIDKVASLMALLKDGMFRVAPRG